MKKQSIDVQQFDNVQPRGVPAHSRRGTLTAAAALAAAGILSATAVRADTGTWTGADAATSTAWSDPLNWGTSALGTANYVPGSTSGTTSTDAAAFEGTATGYTVTLDVARNIQNISLDSATTYTIGTTTGPALRLTSGGSLVATSNATSQTVAAPLVIQGDAGTYSIESDVPGSSPIVTVSGAVSGVSDGTNVTTLTLTGTASNASAGYSNFQAMSGLISDGTGGGKLALVKSGIGIWSLQNAGNSYTGGTTVNAGTINLTTGNTNTTTGGLGTGTVTFVGGTIRLGSTSATTFNNPLVVAAGNTGAITYRGNGTFAPSTFTGSGTLTLGNAAGSVVVSLGGTTLANFTGTLDTTNLGTLRFLTSTTTLANVVLNLAAGTTQSTNFGSSSSATISIGTLTGAGTLGANAAGAGTIVYSIGGRNDPTSTFSGVIETAPGGTATKTGIAKVGTGTFVLTGANTYTGGTTISAGTLVANNAASSLGTAATTVTGGFLAGGTTATPGATGTGAVTLAGGGITGGTGALATSAIGTLVIGSSAGSPLALAQTVSSTYAAKIDGSQTLTATALTPNSGVGTVYTGISDQLVVSTLTLTTGTKLTVNPVIVSPGTLTAGTQYDLVIADLKSTATSAFPSILSQLSLSTTSNANGTYALDYASDGGSGTDLLLDFTPTATPEPTSLLLAGIAAAPLVLGRRRRGVA